jgi:predicted nucleic acid-binding protein
MIVADTNLVAYFVLSGAATKDAERVRAKDSHWVAPMLIRSELLNVISKELTGGRITRDRALRTFRRGMNLVDISKSQADPLFLFNSALSSGCSPYDLEFVWLAIEMAVPLVTADKKILKAFPTVAMDLKNFA